VPKADEGCVLPSREDGVANIGEMAAERAEEIRNEFVACESAPHALMITPGVLEIIARKS